MCRTAFCACFILLGVLLHGTAEAQCPNNVPHVHGTWTTLPYQMPINPISATLLRTGEVLIVAGSENDANNHASGSESYRNAVWDPTGTSQSSIVVQHIYYDVFCSGTAQLPHGRALVVGGTSDYSFTGESRASFYDPLTYEFAQSQNMASGRWYATATALGDGRIMAFSGLGSTGPTNTTVQIYDLASAGTGWGSPINEPFTPPLFPRTFVLPNGKVFYTGQGSGTRNSTGWIFDPGPKTWTASAVTTRERTYGAAVMLPLRPPGYTPKVMNFGGGNPATRTTEVIDLSAGSPSWSPGPDMSTGRIELNATLLPNGKVFVSGGSVNNEAPDTPGKTADVYDPASNSFASGGTASYSRLYHSTALLLPDATVATMGSNPGDRGKYLGAIEIYTPPYLYDANDQRITADRPVITGAPSVVQYGATFSVSYSSVSPLSAAVLVRPGSTTHAFDMDQRLVGLCGPSPQPSCSGAGSVNLTAPPNGNIAPPGYYMLFLLDSSGVPSVARFIELTSFATAPPSGTISSPASTVTINAGSSVFFDSPTFASKYSWVFPGGTPSTSTAKTPGNVTYNTPGEYRATLTVLDASNNSDPSPPSREIVVLPTVGNFEIEVAQDVRAVVPGQSTTYNVTVTPFAGFTGNVSLSVSSEGGFPGGVSSGGFSPSTIVGGSGTSILTMNTTTGAVPYAVSLTIKGTSGSLSHATSATLAVNLAAPGGVNATPSSGQVALSWLASVGASSYRVGRSLVSGGPYQIISCPSTLNYTDTGLTNGTTYYYTVSGVFTGGPNAGGASPPSVEVSAMPPCPVPTYAGTLTASKSGPTDAAWSWTAGGASVFDVVYGDLETLRATQGDFAAALDAIPGGACLVNDTTSLSVADPYGPPPSGSGAFTLLRPVSTSCPAHGTYDEGVPSQTGSRDAEIAAAASACP